MREFLLALHRHPGRAWFGVLVYAAAVTLPHENVQYIVNEIASFITRQHLGLTGQAALYKISAGVILFLGALLTWILYRRLKGQQERGALAAFWILTIGLIWCTWRFGTANNVELVHYPQYVPEGMALLALTLSPVEAMAWVSLFGGLDECFQYWDLMGPKKVPYDFNDIYMDLLGGAVGVLLAMVFLRCDSRGESPSYWRRLVLRPGVVVILGIVVAGIALWAGGFMVLYDDGTNPSHWFALSRVRMPTFWFQVVANGPNKYHTLSPIEGPILILSTIALFAILDRRVRVVGRVP